jgi:hypothetical protein
MTKHTIHLIGSDDDEPASVICEPKDGLCHITFQYRDRVIEEKATDYFEAFCRVRLHLEKDRLIPFCYGASLNVYPSGMCRDMGAGMTAYRISIGKQVDRKNDLVGIFTEAPDVIPASVSKQKEYFDEWIKSK